MKKNLFFLTLLSSVVIPSIGQIKTDTLSSVVIPSIGQIKIDTLYYDRDWRGVESKAFATYFRVVAISNNTNFRNRYRDYYITGELQSEGNYFNIDKYDDSQSIFDGECVTYDKSGNLLEKRNFVNGKLSGEYIKYSDEGLLLVHNYYKNGELDGICTEFSSDGTECVQIEYQSGKPLNDYCVISNAEGCCSKITLSTRKPIYEKPSLDEKEVEFINGEEWAYYNKNGIMVSITTQSVKDYGKYYKLPMIISNNSMFPFDFDPDKVLVSLVDKKGKTTPLKVFSSKEYMKKVRRRQNANMFFNALGEGLAASNAGYSSSTTNSSYSGGSRSKKHSSYGGGSSTYGEAAAVGSGGYASGSYSGRSSYGGYSDSSERSSYYGNSSSTTVSYDGAAAYQAQLIASDRIADYNNALLSERAAKDEGYLKKTTIHPGETISGYIHIERKEGKTINVNVDIKGIIYAFNWKIGK